jgi:hypothetical protein
VVPVAICRRCSWSLRKTPRQSAPPSSRKANCRPSSNCAVGSRGSPTTPGRGSASGPSPDGDRCPRYQRRACDCALNRKPLPLNHGRRAYTTPDQIIDSGMALMLHADACRSAGLVGWLVLRDLPNYPGKIIARLVTDAPTPLRSGGGHSGRGACGVAARPGAIGTPVFRPDDRGGVLARARHRFAAAKGGEASKVEVAWLRLQSIRVP